ncbi:MAG: phosphoribosylformylglycinamidine synthase II, partial [Rhodobacteraceae bacterium]|nr:phosphoribosylformylglycinamidine synthase II [Paracoccaceae bacterium]
GHLGRSALLAELFNRDDGPPPPVDLEAERRHGEFVRANRALIRAACDLSDGGLALAAFEMAAAAGLGVTLDTLDTPTLWGEDQARYLLACPFDAAEALMVAAGQAGVPLACVGRFGGTEVRMGSSAAPLADLDTLWRATFARLFG